MNPNILIRKTNPAKISIGSEASQQLLVYRCAEVLQRHYPSHIWSVNLSCDSSVIAIRCLNVSEQYGYILHTTQVQGDPSLHCVVMAGGEILERGYQKRDTVEGEEVSMSPVFDLTEALRKRLTHQKLSEKVNIMVH